jgi:hypothetical protein
MATNFRITFTRTGGVLGGLLGAVFFAVFLAAGLFFTGMVGREVLANLRTYQWTRADCEVLSSAVRSTAEREERGGDYSVEIEFRYSVHGQSHSSRRWALKDESFSDYGEAQRLASRHPPGSRTVCYVDPANPEQAILKRGSLWSALVILFPLLFVAIGGGGMFFSIRSAVRALRRAPAGAAGPEKALSEKANETRGRRIGALFCGVFLLVGLGAFYAMTVRPVLGILRARSWEKTPCVVISSEIRSHSGDDGSTYSVNILYSYVFRDREYKSNRYHFMGGSSSGYEGKARIVGRHPPGTRTFCYVNPADPTQAVLERGFTSDLWFGLIPLVFVAFGAGGMWLVRRQGRGLGAAGPKSHPARPRKATHGLPEEEAGPAARVLKASAPPWLKLLGGILVAAFWNGILSVFLLDVIRGWRRHHPDWFETIFLIPFVVIGLGMIGFVIYSFLALFNPRLKLTLTPGAVPLGSAFEVRWEFPGRSGAIERLRIHLEGREEAQYRRGTTTCTDKSVFAKIEIVSTTDRAAVRSGQVRLHLPAGLMHSWKADNNKIIWAIRAHGDIAWWPDVKLEFPVTVLPQVAVRSPGFSPSDSPPAA